MSRFEADVAIVGAGILGLAHAYIAAKAGKSVVVFEKNPRAAGASVRNFGMVWPIGQPAGVMLELSLRSRELWLEMLGQANLPRRETGSLHVTYRGDEAAVAQEFAELGPKLGYACSWLSGAKFWNSRTRSSPMDSPEVYGAAANSPLTLARLSSHCPAFLKSGTTSSSSSVPQ